MLKYLTFSMRMPLNILNSILDGYDGVYFCLSKFMNGKL